MIAEADDGRRAEVRHPFSDTPQLTTIRIGTIPERMMYDVKELTVKPGKKVKLTFANPDFMPHNIMLVKPGKADDVGLKAIALGPEGLRCRLRAREPGHPLAQQAGRLRPGGSDRIHRPDGGGRLPLYLLLPRAPPPDARHALRHRQPQGVPRQESRRRNSRSPNGSSATLPKTSNAWGSTGTSPRASNSSPRSAAPSAIA